MKRTLILSLLFSCIFLHANSMEVVVLQSSASEDFLQDLLKESYQFSGIDGFCQNAREQILKHLDFKKANDPQHFVYAIAAWQYCARHQIQQSNLVELFQRYIGSFSEGVRGNLPLLLLNKALLFAANHNASPKILREILGKGANSNCRNFFYKTPLHFCVANLNREGVKLLLLYNAMIDVQDLRRETPLSLAQDLYSFYEDEAERIKGTENTQSLVALRLQASQAHDIKFLLEEAQSKAESLFL